MCSIAHSEPGVVGKKDDAGIRHNAGMLECWDAGMLECWNEDIRNAGMLGCWNYKDNAGMLGKY
jgi:hypothetical protein